MEIRIIDGIVSATLDGELAWRWVPPEGHAVRLLVLEGGDVLVVVEVITYKKSKPSLFRLTQDGRLVWAAEMRDRDDGTYVSAEVSADGGLFANTWSGWRVRLDPATGKIVDQVFVK